MTRESVVLKDRNIVLGVFSTDTFRYFENMPDVVGFGTFYEWKKGMKIMESVHNAAKWAELIIFVLDDVHFPINVERSITCKELVLICTNDTLYNKTIFVKGDNVIEFDRNLIK